MRRIVDWQITEGTHGLVPTGTTGESPTLNFDEHKRVVEITIEAARGRVPVIAGTGSNSTAEAIELSRDAEKAGATGLLIVTPYYNKRRRRKASYQHFKAINDAVGIPILIYNIPGPLDRRHVGRYDGAPARAEEHRRREGCDREPSRASSQQRAAMGPDFIQLSGEDATALGFMAPWRQRLHLGCLEPGSEGFALNSRTPALRVTSRPRWRCRTGSCRCTTCCSSRQIPGR